MTWLNKLGSIFIKLNTRGGEKKQFMDLTSEFYLAGYCHYKSDAASSLRLHLRLLSNEVRNNVGIIRVSKCYRQLTADFNTNMEQEALRRTFIHLLHPAPTSACFILYWDSISK
jgi:hypothetical protein